MLILLSLACTSGADDTGVPDFNYIPLTDDVCERAASDYDATSAQTALEALAARDNYVIEAIEVCSDVQTSTCGGCTVTENPMLDVLRNTDDWADLWDGTVPGDTSLEAYVENALLYPFRWPTVAVDATSSAATLGIVSGDTCELPTSGHMTCADYSLEPESLLSDCATDALAWTADVSSNGGALTVTTSPVADGSIFGFVVPMLGEAVPSTYDADGDGLPDPDMFASADALQTFMESVPGLEIRAEYAHLDVEIDEATGQGCGTITGYVRRSAFEDYSSDASTLDGYLYAADGTVPAGYVKGVFTVELSAASVSVAGDL